MEQCLVSSLVPRIQFSYEKAWEAFVGQQIPQQIWDKCFGDSGSSNLAEYLTVYQMLSAMTTAKGEQPLLEQWLHTSLSEEELHMLSQWLYKEYPQEFAEIDSCNQKVWGNIILRNSIVFPVGEVVDNPDAGYVYEDSWGTQRSYGGERRHEGCDIMADVNERGIYPVYSVTDGIVEKMGWLPQGGYRIGIRSGSGVYYYYAHLASYASELAEGDEVLAGTLLGMMGDTGYSSVAGTTGNFPVHLHFGIYLNREDGTEFAINSYYFLRAIEEGERAN